MHVGNLYLLVVAGPEIALLYIVGTGTGFSQDTTATADSLCVQFQIFGISKLSIVNLSKQ